jgi:hypothetical protein
MPPLIAAAIIMGTTSVAGAAIASKAAGKASKVQKDAEDRALALQQTQYQDAQARYAPYTEMGAQALPTLRSLAGNVQAPLYGTNLKDLSIYGAPPPMPAGWPGMAFGRPVGGGQTSAAAAQGTPMTTGGEMVQLRAPNGAVKAVRRELVPHYVQKGAQVIG